MNYSANTFHFRQDSSFLYFFGHDFPGLVGLIDLDEDKDVLFGYDFTIDDIIWMGPQDAMSDKAAKVSAVSESVDKVSETIHKAIKKGRRIHYLPQYRADNILNIEKWTGFHNTKVNEFISEELIRAVVSQRSVKYSEEIEEIEKALDISYEMNWLAMKITQPGMMEYEIYGAVEGMALSKGGHVSFPVIYSKNVQTLHNHYHGNQLKEGDLVVLDSGAESPLYYASDITRTYPVSGKFSDTQKSIYNIVLEANQKSIGMMKPGVLFRDCHFKAAEIITEGLKDLGFMKGSTKDSLTAGAHALFFPHGLGHMMGLDVHDMENLGEDYVGYDRTVKRSDQFGTAYLRMAKKLEPGYVITVEPGIYFIPELIDLWKSQDKHREFINYDKVEQFRDFSGVRIEDDILVIKEGHRVLGRPIAKTVDEVEAWCGG
jgi:Xaa-Pro aminopeptidase